HLGRPPAHARVHGAAQVHKAEDLELPGLAPPLLVDIEYVARRHRTGVVDQDVGVREFIRERRRDTGCGEVNRFCGNMALADLREPSGGFPQPGRVARNDRDMRARPEETLRHRVADSLRSAGDQYAPALQSEFHPLLPVICDGYAPRPPIFRKVSLKTLRLPVSGLTISGVVMVNRSP